MPQDCVRAVVTTAYKSDVRHVWLCQDDLPRVVKPINVLLTLSQAFCQRCVGLSEA